MRALADKHAFNELRELAKGLEVRVAISRVRSGIRVESIQAEVAGINGLVTRLKSLMEKRKGE